MSWYENSIRCQSKSVCVAQAFLPASADKNVCVTLSNFCKGKNFICNTVFSLLTFLFCLLACSSQDNRNSLVNLAHLNYLCEEVTFADHPATIVHIYCDYPDYHWTDASNEGISCVDDVARAAIVYLRYWEIFKDADALQKARRLLNFVMAMQAEDGEFYNFVDRNLSINRTGRTSRKSFNFWAARGYWAIGLGYRVFRNEDPEFAARLRMAFLRCRTPLKQILSQYGTFETIDKRRYPAWLINKQGSDATSEFLLGVAEYLSVQEDSLLQSAARQLAEGLLAMQCSDRSELYGAFISWPGIWHAWGNSQTQALTRLARMWSDTTLLRAVKHTARSFYGRLLTDGFAASYNLSTAKFAQFPQIAYGIRPMALGLLELYRATGDSTYAVMAGLAGSWLLGNNVAKQAMYDPTTGRTYDGLDSLKINLNAGAESTIEALYTLIEISKVPESRFWLWSRTQKSTESWDQSNDMRFQKIFCCENEKIVVSWDPNVHSFNIQSTQLDCTN